MQPIFRKTERFLSKAQRRVCYFHGLQEAETLWNLMHSADPKISVMKQVMAAVEPPEGQETPLGPDPDRTRGSP